MQRATLFIIFTFICLSAAAASAVEGDHNDATTVLVFTTKLSTPASLPRHIMESTTLEYEPHLESTTIEYEPHLQTPNPGDT